MAADPVFVSRRSSACGTKLRWETYALAHGHLLNRRAFGDSPQPELLCVYSCRQCGGFHVGHNRRLDPTFVPWNDRTSAVQTFGSIGDGYSRRKC